MKYLTVLIIAFSLAGVLVSAQSLAEHYRSADEVSPCAIDAVWDCGVVNHSRYAVFPTRQPGAPEGQGVPVAILGIVGYAAIIAFAGRMPLIAALGAWAGMAFALRLTWIEWKVLKVWCLYCVTSQGIIAVIAALTTAAAVLHWRRRRAAEPAPAAAPLVGT